MYEGYRWDLQGGGGLVWPWVDPKGVIPWRDLGRLALLVEAKDGANKALVHGVARHELAMDDMFRLEGRRSDSTHYSNQKRGFLNFFSTFTK